MHAGTQWRSALVQNRSDIIKAPYIRLEKDTVMHNNLAYSQETFIHSSEHFFSVRNDSLDRENEPAASFDEQKLEKWEKVPLHPLEGKAKNGKRDSDLGVDAKYIYALLYINKMVGT